MGLAVIENGDNAQTSLLGDDHLSSDALLATLMADDSALTQEQRVEYALRLFRRTVEQRELANCLSIAHLMDSDPALDQALESELNDQLTEQPDAIYTFIRSRLAERVDKRWLPRLKMAALYSLRVAISEGDAETITNWLTLVAREPSNYELADVLHYGILATHERACCEPELARYLVLLAAKRSPVVLDVLLNDAALVDALPNNVGRVLRDFDGDPMLLLQSKGPEIFLVGMAQAARAGAGTMFTPASTGKIWDMFLGLQTFNPALPPSYQPASIVQEWSTNGAAFLNIDALEMIAMLMLRDRQDELFLALLHQPQGMKRLFPRLVPILEQSERTINDAIGLIGKLVSSGDMQPQQAANLYATMLKGLEWQKEALPMMEQLARTLTQYPQVDLQPEALWQLLMISAEVREELVAKVALKRLLADQETLDDDGQLVENLRRMAAQSAWDDDIRQIITHWWRGFIRQQPAARLSRLDKVLEGKRALEAERDVLHTLNAVRRMLGGRTLTEFAQDVRAAYTVMEALAESFDPNARRTLHFDSDTVREELSAHETDISPQERQILSNDLKELAHMIAEMGDNRTRGNLVRRGDDLDRDLMAGEQEPHGAVDVMKWLAGYWSGTQDSENEK
jgi:hypothetical protein